MKLLSTAVLLIFATLTSVQAADLMQPKCASFSEMEEIAGSMSESFTGEKRVKEAVQILEAQDLQQKWYDYVEFGKAAVFVQVNF